MSKTAVCAAVVAAGLSALGVAACGSSNNNSADEDQITTAINAAAVSGDPSACTKYQTQRFVEQTSSGTGEAAVRSCEKDASDSVANKVDVTDISVDGDNATAKAEVTGSIFDGQTLDIGLVKENGTWKLDQFKGFENFDKASFVAAFPQEIVKGGGATAQGISCLKTQIEAASAQEIENSFVNNDQGFFNKVFGTCGKYFKGG